MDRSVVQEKIKLFDGIDFLDFETISSKLAYTELYSSRLCKQVEEYNNKISKEVEDYNARLLTIAEEVAVYSYVVFVFRKLFTEYQIWVDEVCNEEGSSPPFDFESVFEGIISKYPGAECSDMLVKYDISEFFDRIMSDSSRFPLIFYHRSYLEMLRDTEVEDDEEDEED